MSKATSKSLHLRSLKNVVKIIALSPKDEDMLLCFKTYLRLESNECIFGLTNFILGYHEHIVAIVEPEILIEHIKNHIGRINFLEN